MKPMRRNLYLYLTLACFIALLAIFVADGYLGIYDTLYITAGEREEKIEADFWLRQGRGSPPDVDIAYYASTNWDEKVFLGYEVDNRWFSSYSADIEVSVWRSREKVRDLASQEMLVAAFDKGEVEWVLDTALIKPDDLSLEQTYEYTVIIKRGEIERRIVLHISPAALPSKVFPVPQR